MRLGMIGTDARLQDLAAAARRRGDTLVAAPVDGGKSWEPLLDAGACDAVAVGMDDDRRHGEMADAVRLLVQAGRTVVVPQPLVNSMLWAYELDMVARDSGAVLVPWLPSRLHPYVARLKQQVEEGVSGAHPLGPLESVRFERAMELRTRETVLAALARDADLVRILVGEPERLATLGAGDADSAWPTLAVGFSGQALVPVRWQVSPGARPGLSIVLQHARGSVDVWAPDEVAPWIWHGPPEETLGFDPAATMLEVLQAVVDPAHGDRTVEAGSATIVPADWADAARAIELADTVPRSLAKGRAVDLHREEFSELNTFRGTMASLGCGLVLAALLLLVTATLVAGMAREFGWEFGVRLADAWPTVILVALVAFLALQLLPMVVGGGRSGSGTPGPKNPGKLG
jgi:predicted dehydrogenase